MPGLRSRFKPKDGTPPKDSSDGTRDELTSRARSARTPHQGVTDPESSTHAQGQRPAGKLSYGDHASPSRNEPCVDILITESTQAEHRAARRPPLAHVDGTFLRRSAPTEYHGICGHLRRRCATARRAHQGSGERPAWMGEPPDRVTRSASESESASEIFGWLKTVGGLRKTRFIGQAKTRMAAFISGAAYNLLRIAKIERFR